MSLRGASNEQRREARAGCRLYLAHGAHHRNVVGDVMGAKKPGPKVKAPIRGRGGRTVVSFYGKRNNILAIAEAYEIPGSVLYERWKRAGCPRELDEKLCRPVHTQQNTYTVTLLPEGEQMSVYKLASKFNLNFNCISYRVRRFGKTEFTREDLAEIDNNTRKFTGNKTANYDDPEYLPHIVKGDLEHLSDHANFGRGKGEIPDEQWIALTTSEKRRQPMSIETLLRFSSSSSTCFHPE